jgi:hypothetical protein
MMLELLQYKNTVNIDRSFDQGNLPEGEGSVRLTS